VQGHLAIDSRVQTFSRRPLPFLWSKINKTRQIPSLAEPLKGTKNSLNSSRSPAIVARNSSTSHLCAFASDCAAFLAKSESEICGFGSDPEAVEVAGVSQVLSVATASRSEVSNALSRSHAASGAPSGKRSIVANGGGCKSNNFFLFQSHPKQEREVEVETYEF
jgi:hypothetical protein